MELKVGKFYTDREGSIWCCYRIRMHMAFHAQADCIRLTDSRVEYFYLDGRYDTNNRHKSTLIQEVSDNSITEDDGSTKTEIPINSY